MRAYLQKKKEEASIGKCKSRTCTSIFIMREHDHLTIENFDTIMRIVNKFELIWNYCSLNPILHAKFYFMMPESVKSEDWFTHRKESLFWEMETSLSFQPWMRQLAPLKFKCQLLIRLDREFSGQFYLWRIYLWLYMNWYQMYNAEGFDAIIIPGLILTKKALSSIMIQGLETGKIPSCLIWYKGVQDLGTCSQGSVEDLKVLH